MTPSYSPEATTVVLLAAGFGSRMQDLTKTIPKPMLKVGKYALIEHHLHRLNLQGFKEVVINIAYLGDKIKGTLGSGDKYGLSINYSDESATGALETAGGLKFALPLIKSDPFLVINSDIWTDLDFRKVLQPLSDVGRLVMVPNPSHNPEGDFSLSLNGKLEAGQPSGEMTFAGVALYRKAMFSRIGRGKQALGPIFKQLIRAQQLEGIEHQGAWTDVGTPERLKLLNQQVSDG